MVGGLPRSIVAAVRSSLRDVVVHHVATGAEVLDWLAGRDCSPLVLDHSLPGIDAAEVVRRLTGGATSFAIPVPYCLGPGRLDRAFHARIERLGVRNFVTQPLDADQLSVRVRQMLLRDAVGLHRSANGERRCHR